MPPAWQVPQLLLNTLRPELNSVSVKVTSVPSGLAGTVSVSASQGVACAGEQTARPISIGTKMSSPFRDRRMVENKLAMKVVVNGRA